MEFTEAEDHASIRRAIREICAGFPEEYWRERDAKHEFPWDFYHALAKAGWVGIAIPEEYGGGGAGITEASIVLEEIAASGAAMNGAAGIHLSVFGMNPVVKHGSAEQKAKYLPQVASGELTHGGFAYAREYNVGRYFLESRLMRIAPVPQEMVLNFVSEHVLRLPRSY